MVAHRRGAEIVATLVKLTRPELLALKSGKSLMVAVAVPDEDKLAHKFFATTVSQKDWDSYLDESVDLRYLYTYPVQRMRYTFDLRQVAKKKVMMDPFPGEVPDAYLPLPRFFSDNHTEDFDAEVFAASTETLIVDGAWDMPEFGRFYQRYSDIYAFLVAILNWNDAGVAEGVKAKVREAFSSKPFQGGSSYLHFYQDLLGNLARGERLSLNEIQYASPGHVEVEGREDAFEDVQGVIRWFMDHRAEIHKQSQKLRAFLSKQGFLQLAGDHFPKDSPFAAFISAEAKALNALMHGPDFAAIEELSKGNQLVAAKVVLSFYRRVDDAAEFFSQGRVNFSG